MAKIFAGSGAEVGNESERQFETTLISLVKFLPCLYDPSNPNYNNMQQNKIAWFKLSSTLKKSVTECINKWYALLQIFLCLNKQLREQETHSPITWPHYYAMLRLNPNLSLTYYDLVNEKPPFLYSKPVIAQKELLVNEMDFHREILLSADISIEQKQKIWLLISRKLNAIVNGVNMPVIKWQKYWCDLKQSVIDIRLRQNRTKVQSDGKYQNELLVIYHRLPSELSRYSDDDVKILQFCGVRGSDSLSKINVALSGALEIGCDLEKVVVKCRRCNNIIQAPVNQKYCSSCGLLPKTFCDICLRIYQSELTVYEVKNWSREAKNLLPPHLSSFASISACEPCSDELKKNSGANWKACRICENYNHPLDNLFSSGNEVLRKAFMDATNIAFKETDGLPGYICKVCKVQMQQFNNFYLKFNRVQTRLNEIHDEFFIGVPGIVLTKTTQVGRDNLNLPVRRCIVLKSNSNSLSEAGNNEEINEIKPPTVVQTVQKFTIPSSTSQCTTVKINKNVKIKQIAMPGIESSCASKPINRINAPQNVPGIVGNTVITDKPSISQTSQGLQKLQLLNGIPVVAGAQTKQSPSAQVVVNGSAKKLLYKPILPKPAPVQISANPVFNKNSSVALKPVTLRPPGSGVKLGNQTTVIKEKPSAPKTVAPVSTTISGILAQQKINGSMPSTITIKTQSGTTSLCPTAMNIQTNNVKRRESTMTTSSSSVTLVNNSKIRRMSVYPTEKVTKPTSSPTVFKIADDMFDPNSPPAFCIPKSGNQISGSTFKIIPGNLTINQLPQKPITPEIIPPIVEASTIKTEKIDEGELTDRQPAKKDDSMTCNSSAINKSPDKISTIESCPTSSAATVPTQQSVGNNGKLPEKPRTDIVVDTGAKKPQPHPTHQSLPSTGSKRPRKYWGAVDEFHIPSKVPNQAQPNNEICPQISIKEETVDLEEENINKGDNAANIENLNMFYPDSFELGNVSLDADVTNVLKHMIAHHQTSNDSENYQFNKPSFNMPINEKANLLKNGESKANSEPTVQLESKSKDASKTNTESATSSISKSYRECKVKINVESKAQPESKPNESKTQHKHKATVECKAFDEANSHRELKTKEESKKKEDIPKENKNKINISNFKKFHVKKLRVKLKRNKKLQNLVLRNIKTDVVARSCTLVRRKSMRLNKTIF